jgi:formyltetrahydrofolate-dependent phosphoribosylglycinamide formyltransferase
MGAPYIQPRQGSISHPLRIAVLISGGGSGLLALLNHQHSKPTTHITKLIISDNENAKGLQYGDDFQISTIAINLPQSHDRAQQRILHENIIHERLIESNIELIVLNGYMRILTPEFVKKWKGRLTNIHPSLLPKYPGANAQRDALEDGATITGCTVHLVDEGVDTGKILAQSEVPILQTDTIEILQNRIKEKEHLLYPKVLDDYCAHQSIQR